MFKMTKGWHGIMIDNRLKLNIGPQHPSTHGVLRLLVELEGEVIKSCEPIIGYLHRGIEKMAESRTYLQYLPVVDRVDYLGGFFNSYAFCAAVEDLAQIETSKRTQYIRVLTMEMNRLSSHLLWLGSFLLDMGATTPLFYTFRDREDILSLFEDLTGQRMMYNYYTFGGVRHDVSTDWLDKVSEFVVKLPEKIDDYENIITNNPIFTSRTQNIGVISSQLASDYSITGPNLRASGIKSDLRKDYLVYDELEYNTSVLNKGDAYSRYLIRIKEMRECIEIIFQCCEWLKANTGEVISKVKPAALKLEGETIVNVEAPRGVTSCYLKAEGMMPNRVKWRTGSYYAVQILPKLLENSMYADLMAIFGSLDVILPEVDR